MRGRLLNLPAVVRVAGFALVAIAIVAATLHFRQHEPRRHPTRLAPRLARVPLRGRAAARVGQAQPGCLGAERRPPDAFTGSGGDDLVVMPEPSVYLGAGRPRFAARRSC